MCLLLRICILVAAIVVYSIPGRAQSLSDTLRLDDIIIEATRVPEPRKQQPLQIQIIDSLQLRLSGASSLAQVLESHSGVFIRNYGPAGVSTISQRGMMAHQTQILWNGFNLNHPMLGLFDLNTFSSGMLSSIEINSAGSSTYGSGSMGGSIMLGTNASHRGLEVSQSAGSFGRFVTSAQAGTKGKGWKLNMQGIMDHSENDYPYLDYTRNPAEEQRRSNNRVETRGMVANGSYQAGNNVIRSGFWYSHSHRGVPGPLVSLNRLANQEDEFIRWFGEYRHDWGKVDTGAKLYLNRQELNFIDPGSSISSLSTNNAVLLEVPVRYVHSHIFEINGYVSTSATDINSTAYTDRQDRKHSSAQVNPLIRPNERLRLYPALRYDKYSDFGHALSYSFGMNYEVLPENLYWRAYVSSDFNAPTFNDLYWPESGNRDLQPEEGWKAETGFFNTIYSNGIFQQTDGQVFMSRLENGIQWLPDNTGNFTPQNIREIQARGFELQSNTTLLGNAFQVQLSQLLSGTWSTYVQPRFENDQATGNQLTHTPVWQYRLTASLFYGPVKGMITHRRVGKRFTDENNFNTIDAYSASDLSLSYTVQLRKFTSDIQWNVNNLFNTAYEVIPYYPIPGRNHLFTIRLKIQ